MALRFAFFMSYLLRCLVFRFICSFLSLALVNTVLPGASLHDKLLVKFPNREKRHRAKESGKQIESMKTFTTAIEIGIEIRSMEMGNKVE